MEAIIFTDETLNDGTELLVEEHDLPEGYEYETKLRKNVTYYAGTYASLQVHGLERMPIDITGVVDDSWWGEPGHAARFVNNCYALAESGHLVRFEYDGLQLWGVFDFKSTRRTDERYDYTIKFSPFWARNPKFESFIDFAAPPAEIPVEIADYADNLVARAEAPPENVLTSFAGEVLLDLKRAQAALNAPLGVLDNVATYAELTEAQVRNVARSLYNGVDAAGRAVERIAAASFGAVDAAGSVALAAPARVTGYAFYERLRRDLRILQADTIGTIRELIRAVRPARATTHSVGDGDTLSRIAQRYLGDHARWTEIADANDLETPTLVTGQVLNIPPKERPA